MLFCGGMGQTRLAFLITTASNVFALIASYMLIFGRGLPAIGPYGAIWGTVLSQFSGGVLVLIVLVRHESIRLRPGLMFCYRPAIIARIIAVSLPAALEQLALQGGRIVYTFMLAGVGAVQFAAHQIALQAESILLFAWFCFFGCGHDADWDLSRQGTAAPGGSICMGNQSNCYRGHDADERDLYRLCPAAYWLVY